MRPFRSVGQALRFHFLMRHLLNSAKSLDLAGRLAAGGGTSTREDLLAACLSVSLCLDRLEEQEIRAVTGVFTQEKNTLDPGGEIIYHRAMTKLGREMRRRGVVG